MARKRQTIQNLSRAPFIQRIMTAHNLPDTISLLSRTPATLNTLLRDLPETWTMRNEGDKTWNAYGVIGHLVSGERHDWMPRLKTILQFGDTRPFEPFDRWAQERESLGKSLGQLLDEFGRLRAENLKELGNFNLQTADLERRGSHPSLGAVTMSELLATWVVHDLTHVHQISRIMAHQYREAVGPWEVYLGVLKCGGHSSS
ncbi:MAG TPA: DinB family protein [Terriglobales bacterium]|nr:DinB family protein [Terriglobales bacterium]